MGGLCELAVAAGIADFQQDEEGLFYGPAGTDRRDGGLGWDRSVLPVVVSKWAGLGLVVDPVVMAGAADDSEPVQTSLTQLNDEWQLNFHQIADLIETQL
jgi:hypothetical protein